MCIKNGEETKRLLAESQLGSIKFQQQEEEMRQNFEELMATQEEMTYRQDKMTAVIKGKMEDDDTLESSDRLLMALDKDGGGNNAENRVREAIQRQKILLESAYERNQEKVQAIREKVEKN